MKKPVWYYDFMRTVDKKSFDFFNVFKELIFHHGIRYVVCFRKAQNTKSKLLKFFYEYKLYRMSRKYGLEIKTNTEIGESLVLIHPYNITVSPQAKIGRFVNLMKGCTIGRSCGGKNIGSPTIGDRVFVGINSTIVGNITIGNDVLIAPNTLVNVDVPSHSIVIGNPCRVIHRENATKEYIYSNKYLSDIEEEI